MAYCMLGGNNYLTVSALFCIFKCGHFVKIKLSLPLAKKCL